VEARQQEKQGNEAKTTGHGAFFQKNEKARKVRRNFVLRGSGVIIGAQEEDLPTRLHIQNTQDTPHNAQKLFRLIDFGFLEA
jgi:hypothetical protein